MYNPLVDKLHSDSLILNYNPRFGSITAYLKYLNKEYGLNSPRLSTLDKSSDLKAIFDIAIRPLLKYCLDSLDIELYSEIDHFLFKAYICPFEDIEWFAHAFWDVNHYGLQISRRARNSFIALHGNINNNHSKQPKKILLVHKGGTQLANFDVLKDFLSGIQRIDTDLQVYLLLIDAPPMHIPGVKVYSLSSVLKTKEKLQYYSKLCVLNQFYNIIWVACVQNMMLYMGLELAKRQTYWTMKRHSITCPQINKYATFISQYRNITHNNALWYGGRYRLKTTPSTESRNAIILGFTDKEKNIIKKATVTFGSLARAQKYTNLDYWKGIEQLLRNIHSSVFIYGTQLLPKAINDYVQNSEILKSRSINFGWLNGETARIAALIDIYIDTIPFGSGLTAAQSVLYQGAYIGTLSEINKEASFTNILFDAYQILTGKSIDNQESYKNLGIFRTFNDSLDFAIRIANSKELRRIVHTNQKKALISLDKHGMQHFTSDYLNYFAS